MEHILDIDTEVFEKIKNHETLQIEIPSEINQRRVKEGDDLKLYHPGNPAEALRIHLVKLTQRQKDKVLAHFELSEWMFWMETELDELLKEEEKLWEGLF